MTRRWHVHAYDDGFAPRGAILCGKYITRAIIYRNKAAKDATSRRQGCGWLALVFLSSCVVFNLSGVRSSPGPVPTVMLINRWRVFTGADMSVF